MVLVVWVEESEYLGDWVRRRIIIIFHLDFLDPVNCYLFQKMF